MSAIHAPMFTSVGGDPYWGNVVLFMPFSDASQLTDAKGHEFLTNNSGISSTGGVFGEGYLSLPGTSSYIYGDNTGLTFDDLEAGSSNWTWECFLNHDPTGGDVTGLIYTDGLGASPEMYFTLVRDTGIITCQFHGGASLTSVDALPANTDVFMYVQRSGDTFTLYLDNVLQDTDTYSGSISSADSILPYFGNDSTGAKDAKLKISNLRFTIGVSRNSPGIPSSPFPST